MSGFGANHCAGAEHLENTACCKLATGLFKSCKNAVKALFYLLILLA
jgi:hypothetical protein